MLSVLLDDNSELQQVDLNVPACNISVFTESKQAIKYFYDNIVLSGVNGISWGHSNNAKEKIDVYFFIKPQKDIIEIEQFVKHGGRCIGRCVQQLNGYYDKYVLDNNTIYLSPRIDKGATQSIIYKDKNRIVLLSSQGKYDYKLLTRVLREIAYRKLEADGWVALHASGVQYDDTGILIMGDAAVGKTTLSLSMCVKKGSKFLGNDKIIVKKISNQLIATGFSSSARLNFGTLKELQLDKTFLNWNLQNDIPKETSDWKSFDGKNKLSLLPSELNSYLGIEIIPSMKINKIVFPKIINIVKRIIKILYIIIYGLQMMKYFQKIGLN